MRLIITVLAIAVSFASIARAEECGVDLKQSDSYRELSAALKCLQRKILKLEQQQSKTKGIATSPSLKLNYPNADQTVDTKRFSFSYPKCIRDRRDVRCTSYLTNKSNENYDSFTVYMTEKRDRTQAFTDQMTHHAIYAGSFSNWQASHDRAFSINFPSSVTIPLNWKIKSVPTDAKGFQIISITTQDGTVQFKNVRITR